MHSFPHRLVVLILGVLACIGPFSIDTYLPAFAEISQEFKTSPEMVQQTLGVYSFAYAFMTLFYGTLSDSFGRKRIVLIALSLYFLASFICFIAPSIEWLIFGRLLQGFSAGAGSVVGQAIVTDCYKGAQAQRVMSYIVMVFSISPALAPLLGGYLLIYSGWRTIFVFLGVLALCIGLLTYFHLPETLATNQRQPFLIRSLLRNYWIICQRQYFLPLTIAFSMLYIALGFLVGAAPDFIMNTMHLPATDFYWLFIPIMLGLIGGSYTVARFAGFMSSSKMLKMGFFIILLSGLVNVVYTYLAVPKMPYVVIPIAFFALGFSILSPNLTIHLLSLQTQSVGMAASILGFMQMLFFSIASGVLTPLIFGSAFKLSSVLFLSSIISGFSWWMITSRLKPS